MKGPILRKFRFYLRHAVQAALPRFFYQGKLAKELALVSKFDAAQIEERVNYYCKTDTPFSLPETAKIDSELSIWKYASGPCLDLRQHLRYFPSNLRFECDFRDNHRTGTWRPTLPAFVKCRPVDEHNANAVLMKLNSNRFFNFNRDRLSFHEKRPVAVFRGPCYREHRQIFVERCHQLPHTDIGDTRKSMRGAPTYRPFLNPDEQLRNKFIVSLEGNDVSSGIVWIMASNSLTFTTIPRFEGWFMQGKLMPNYHYVLLRDDYADLAEKIDYYTHHPQDALAIISNAQKHVAQFFDYRRERLISLLILRKYFVQSGQLEC